MTRCNGTRIGFQSCRSYQALCRGAEVLHSAFSTAITVSGIPFSLVDLGAAWVYGFRAAMCMLLFAKTLGSILCFLVARSVLPAARKASVLSHPTVARVDRILASSPIYYGTLFRLALLPTFVKNYGLALLNIRFPHYLTCCLLGSCLGVPAQAYLGSQLGDIYLGLREAESVDPVILWGGPREKGGFRNITVQVFISRILLLKVVPLVSLSLQ
ncbi:unnamed protein product [Symbiodinium sp. CCMP2592]|nr:unnamed protein product [Symbiodinium sp. CCMP2592]